MLPTRERDKGTAEQTIMYTCLVYKSDAGDDLLCLSLGGSWSIQKKITYTT